MLLPSSNDYQLMLTNKIQTPNRDPQGLMFLGPGCVSDAIFLNPALCSPRSTRTPKHSSILMSAVAGFVRGSVLPSPRSLLRCDLLGEDLLEYSEVKPHLL